MKRETLTKQQIIAATIELLDREGLDGFSMRILGSQLGSAATAVYWHVGSKENLIALAGDQVWNEIPLPDLNAVNWRTAAKAMAIGLNDMLGRHRWLVRVFGSQRIYGPGKARHDDHCLAIFEAGGFRGKQADRAATSVFIFVLGTALCSAAEASFKKEFSEAEPETQRKLREQFVKMRDIASQFPRLRDRIKDASADYGSTPEDTFQLGLDALLDGIEAQVAKR